MRPGRSRRVQAQRKFAQGVFVPPNAVAPTPTESRRDVIQDPSNVTRNNMSATNLLDVISLSSAVSSPTVRQGLHNHLTSQPVVILERLRGGQQARCSSPQPSSSQSDTSPPRPIRCQEARESSTPVEGPKRRATKIADKRVHTMSLRSGHLTKKGIDLSATSSRKASLKRRRNSFVEESATPSRKVTFNELQRTRRNSSDEDVPLIYQRNKEAFKTKRSLKRAGGRHMVPIVSILKRNPSLVDLPEQYVPFKSGTAKQSVSKKQNAPKVSTPGNSSALHPKTRQRTTRSSEKSRKHKLQKRTPEHSFSGESSPEQSFSENSPKKSQANKNKKVTPQKKNVTKKSLPGRHSYKLVESVEVEAIKVRSTDEPLRTDATLPQNDARTANYVFKKQGALANDVMLATEGDSSALDGTVAKHPIWHPYHLVTLGKEGEVAKEGMLANEGTLGIESTRESALDIDVMNATEIANVIDDIVDIDDILAVELEVTINHMPVSETTRATETALHIDNQVPSIPSLDEDEESLKLRFDENSDDESEPIRSFTPSVPGVTNVVNLQKAPRNLSPRVISPVPGPSGMQHQSTAYDPGNDEHKDYYSNTRMCLGNKEIKVRYLKEVLHNTCISFERDKNQKKTEVRTDKAEHRHNHAEGQGSDQVSSENAKNLSSERDLSNTHPEQGKTNRVRHSISKSTERRLARAKRIHDFIKAEKIEKEKQEGTARIKSDKTMSEEDVFRFRQKYELMEKEKIREIARLEIELREKLRAEMEADINMAEVDEMARELDNETDAKNMNQDPDQDLKDDLEDSEQPGPSGLGSAEAGVVVDAPIYYPTAEEFADPLKFYEKIRPDAVKFGICKIVPPPGWEPPPPKLNEDMRFDVTNQFISRLLSRWGPAAREYCAIKLCLILQNIHLNRIPSIDGVEINLPKLYHMVQRHGGLEEVINKKRWGKVAEDMNFTRGTGTEKKLDQIYVKYLLPYDTLSHKERQEIMAKVEVAWRRKTQKLFERAINPLYRQKRMLGLQEESEEETEDPDTQEALAESEDCIVKGSSMNLGKFKKVATYVYESAFGQGSESGSPRNVKDIEEEYWRLVTNGAEHTCVSSATIDTGDEGYGFTKNKDEPYGSHPWNPKMVSQNPRNVLSYLEPTIGLTIPTLLVGMLFSTSCWHKDPQQILWLEYQIIATRVWYGIPEAHAEAFRKSVELLSPTSAQNKSLWLPTDITMIPPDMLRQHNVTLSRVEQGPGEFVMVFPNAYTCCISTGYSVAESVYFAPPSWLERLSTVFKETRESCEPTMFALENLLYNIARDPTADKEIVQIAQPIFERMLHEEVTNRQMLQERGIDFVQELQSDEATPSTSSGRRGPRQYTPSDQEECEYCRATLYLSKVRGLTGRDSLLCLEHGLMILDTEKYRDADVSDVEVLVHVSVKELNTYNDDMKRRLA